MVERRLTAIRAALLDRAEALGSRRVICPGCRPWSQPRVQLDG